jgi:hypothetical protein
MDRGERSRRVSIDKAIRVYFLGDNAKILLHRLLLVDVAITVPRQLLHQAKEMESEVINVLPGPEREAVPQLAQLLHRRLPGMIEADPCGGDGILGIIGARLVRQGGHHLQWNRALQKTY